jgi:HK97 gp10 family phage protein
MARGFNIVVVYNAIPALIAFVESESRAAVKASADRIAQKARNYAPVDTGALRNSIEAVSNIAGKEAEVRVSAPYAAYVEYGTYKMDAQPFLTPAVREEEAAFFASVGKGLFASFGG